MRQPVGEGAFTQFKQLSTSETHIKAVVPWHTYRLHPTYTLSFTVFLVRLRFKAYSNRWLINTHIYERVTRHRYCMQCTRVAVNGCRVAATATALTLCNKSGATPTYNLMATAHTGNLRALAKLRVHGDSSGF